MESNTKTITKPFEAVEDQLFEDMKSATFIVSVLINIALFVGWLALQLAR